MVVDSCGSVVIFSYQFLLACELRTSWKWWIRCFLMHFRNEPWILPVSCSLPPSLSENCLIYLIWSQYIFTFTTTSICKPLASLQSNSQLQILQDSRGVSKEVVTPGFETRTSSWNLAPTPQSLHWSSQHYLRNQLKPGSLDISGNASACASFLNLVITILSIA